MWRFDEWIFYVYDARDALTESAVVVVIGMLGVVLGYALPGAVIAVGILLPLGRLDNVIAAWAHQQFGVNPGLLLTGSIIALIYAYVVRFLAVAFKTVEAGLTRVAPSMDDAARSLGLSPVRTLVRVHVPIMWGSLATAALLVFVDVMKELPATFAMRPFNFDTLAVEAYNLAKDERIAEAAVPSLLMVVIALVPLIVLSRQITRSGRGQVANSGSKNRAAKKLLIGQSPH